MSETTLFKKGWNAFNRFFEVLKPLGDFFIRILIFKVFFLSGLVKIQSWSSTLLLFQFEYHVPLISPELAAVIATSIELGVSTLLLLGIGGRIPALILFIFNLTAALFYPFLWSPAGQVGLKDHYYWGLLIMILLLHGTGKLSFDYLYCSWRKKKQAVNSS